MCLTSVEKLRRLIQGALSDDYGPNRRYIHAYEVDRLLDGAFDEKFEAGYHAALRDSSPFRVTKECQMKTVHGDDEITRLADALRAAKQRYPDSSLSAIIDNAASATSTRVPFNVSDLTDDELIQAVANWDGEAH